ncbi:hypothetical protein ACF0H5_014146 [Mactra antiquata]
MGTTVILFLLILCGFGAFAEDKDAVLQRLEELSQRVDHLESREKLHLQKINNLELRDQLQQATIDKLEKEVQEQRQLIETMEETQHVTIIELEIQRQLLDSMDVNHSKVDYNSTQRYSEKQTKPSYRNHFHSPTAIKKRSANRIRQAEFDSTVAFYATMHYHHFEHGGVGQIIIYDNIITNAGNGYNGSIGVFTAPVEGIYVFFNNNDSFFESPNISFCTQDIVDTYASQLDSENVLNFDFSDKNRSSPFDELREVPHVKTTKFDQNGLLQRLEATEELVKLLSHRVDQMESREKLHLQKINNLEQRDQLQQTTIYKLEKEVQEQRQLFESLEEIQQATIIQLETQKRQLIETMELTKQASSTEEKRQHMFKEPREDNYSQSDNNNTLKYFNARIKSGNRDNHFQSLTSANERSVEKTRQAEFETPFAFYATIGNTPFEHGGAGQVIVYDNIITNAGNGYNGHLGTFTAQVEGIYVFSTTMVALGHVDAHASFYKNSDKINIMFVSGVEADYDTSSSTVVLELQKGDVVTVRNVNNDRSFAGKGHSSFSGFLLSSYNNNPVIVGK